MKQIIIRRHGVTVLAVELGFWDLLRILLGREIVLVPIGEAIVLRSGAAYQIFNLAAPKAD